MGYYVEIPYDQLRQLRFPARCPFTNQSVDALWEVRGQSLHDAVFIPGLPVGVASGQQFTLSIPVSKQFAVRQYRLAVAATILLSSLLFFLIAQWLLRIELSVFLAIVPLSGLLVLGIRQFQNRKVWIDYVGNTIFEIVFASQDYAKEFCDLNGLSYRWKFFNFRFGSR